MPDRTIICRKEHPQGGSTASLCGCGRQCALDGVALPPKATGRHSNGMPFPVWDDSDVDYAAGDTLVIPPAEVA